MTGAAPRIATVDEVAEVLQRDVGLHVKDVRRQLRWRPTWSVDADRDGAPVEQEGNGGLEHGEARRDPAVLSG